MKLRLKDSKMNFVIKKQGIFKRFLDARWAWDLIQGPVYNRLVLKEEIYRFATKFTAWYVWDPFMRWYLRRVVFGQSYTRKEAELMARAAGFSQVWVEKVSESPFFLMKLRK